MKSAHLLLGLLLITAGIVAWLITASATCATTLYVSLETGIPTCTSLHGYLYGSYVLVLAGLITLVLGTEGSPPPHLFCASCGTKQTGAPFCANCGAKQ